MMQSFKLSEIRECFSDSDLIIEHFGANPVISGISSVDNCQQGELTFVSNKKYLESALQKKPAALIVPTNLIDLVKEHQDIGILTTKNVKLAHALIKQAFGNRDFIDDQWGEIHSSAVIHKTVTVPSTCFIGPNVVIGKNSVLGERCRILAGVVIENNVSIGDNCIFHPNCVIGYSSKIASDVEIGACTVIGTEGFGFAQDSEGKSHKIPQTGIVEIDEHVLLGACNTIDRATYGVTKIGAGTKTDNLVHIAHNCTIGKDCLFTPMLAVAGSTTFGDRCITSGQTQISDHINICDDVFLVHRAGVIKDITEPGIYGGMPLYPLKKHVQNTSYVNKLSDLNKKVKLLEKMINKLTKENNSF